MKAQGTEAVSDPLPLETTDPDLAEHFRLVVNGTHPSVRAVSMQSDRNVYVMRNGRVVQCIGAIPGRNDPCHCGSGKKFKKCHGR